MGTRIFNRTLDCGCMYSSDGGGGLIPCCYDNSDIKQVNKCTEAHKKWYVTDDYKKYCQECIDNN